MAEIMVLGDTHGNTNEAILAVQNASVLNIDTIIQVGDFGLWDHMKDGIEYLDELNNELISNGIHLIWVDGNHENFDRLEWYVKNNPKNKWGQVYIRSNILYSPRGCKWKAHDRTFMSVGGAVSVDKDWRIRQQSRHNKTNWWPQEQLTDQQLEKIIRDHTNSPGKVDFLFTHDCPSNAPFKGRRKDDLESVAHRQKMDLIGHTVQPNMWFHGHMHTKYDGYDFPTYEPTTTVYGIECDGMRWNWGILDTETYTFEWGYRLKTMDLEPDNMFNGRRGEWVEWRDDNAKPGQWINDEYGTSWLEGYGYNEEPFDIVLPD